ncbi:MAG: hypothetical protein SWJ54_19775, partial [Cyanobacteriota bacterium]|nr:hypothetical protein [Cyanobacteriota bacterium]
PPEPTSASDLELPSFGNFLSDTPEQLTESTTASSAEPNPTSVQTPKEEVLSPTNETPSDTPSETTSLETTPSQTDDFESQEAQLVPVSPVDPAFRALNLENRFWSRLNSLAQDQDLSQWMKQAKPTPLPDTSFVQTRPDESPKTPVPTPPPEFDPDPLFPSLEDEFESQEIVVDDEPEPLETQTASDSSPPRLRLVNSPSAQPPTVEESTAVSDQGPIAAPLLEVIDPEVVAGRTVKVRVQMNENIPRTYVKIWVYDRQSRGIVDGPRWLTEFLPNGLGQIETTVNLQIAYGSLEVQFEAIAVEMQTQRESHKVIVERSVIPTASPTLPLDEE